jgi:hypothetical protein
MTTNNKAVTCYLPKDIEDFITGYCIEYGITRKDKEGNIYPSLGTGIIELLKLLAYNPELVGSPILDTVPSKFSEDAIEKKIDEILEKKLNSPDTVPSQLPDLEGKVESIILDKLPSIIPEYLPSDLLARIENMERLLRLQQSASIADHSPRPPSPAEPGRPAIEPTTLPPDDQNAIESDPANPPVTEAIEPAIETAIGDEPAIEDAIKVKPRRGYSNSELSEKINISKSTIEKWKARIQRGEKFEPKVYPNFFDHWILDTDNLWYEKD